MLYDILALLGILLLIGFVAVFFALRGSSRDSMEEDADQLEQELAFGIDRDMNETQRAAREVA